MYLDEDILCLQEISELVHLDMGKHLAAVVSDVLSVARRQSEALNLQSECYFNAGVLLINVHQWLKQNISEKALSLLSDRSKNYVFLDQDALNLILDNAKKILPQKWNFISEKHEKTNIPKNTILLHCAANPKPWDIFCDKKHKPINFILIMKVCPRGLGSR
ncbi:Glycosyl transferase family 8 [Dendrosporobacter quercicolus]|uniref:Glycosyl transferase family 8 n=1 Tax=Dendrosporobacter quercicolus TaxID=146817 RepID=A0A1G9YU19_9FIRM|nr:Glycosyl transferase family 8 [Dendrosporobacter quercicolus]